MLQQAMAGLPRMRWLFLLSLIPLLGSCINPPPKKPVIRTPVIQPAQPLKLNKLPPELIIEQNTHLHRVPPVSYNQWLNQGFHQQQVNRYHNYLIRHDASRAAPIFELLKSARDWERCGREPYAVPSSELWDNLLPTLKVLQQLQDEKILDNIEVTSVYRDAELNHCANGSPGSKHVHNAALDFRIGSENPNISELEKIARAKHRLCEFWQRNGRPLNLGLGLYASGQIHIDTQGFRTWGPDHTHSTSICSS
jgi:uncharacterized protein YcbK (DUF882 family)